MKPYVKMMLMNAGNGGNDRRDSSRRSLRGEYDGGGRMEGGRRDGGRMEYGPDMEGGERGYQERPRMGGGYEVDSRFRDRRGREHYDNGRFAPMPGRRGRRGPRSEGGNMEMNGYDGGNMRRGPRMDDDDDEEDMRGDYWPMPPYTIPPYGGGDEVNEIGFERVGMRAEHSGSNDMEHRWSEKESGHAKGYGEFTHEDAKEWTKQMHNEDGTTGPHWTMEQVKQVMAQHNIKHDAPTFWAILNSIYSDYCAVFKKHGVNTMDMYIDMAKAWLDDKDAVKDKAGAYYECVVKH